MKLFDTIRASDVIKFGRELVLDTEFFFNDTVNEYAELSYADRMGCSQLQLQDQEITLEDGYATVVDMDGDQHRLRFCTLTPLTGV
jgi:hypothetical protein